VKFLIWLYVFGLITFYSFASFDIVAEWDFAYHLWQKTCDAGIVVWLTFYITGKKENRNLLRWLIAFGCIRLGWEIVSYFWEIPVNDYRAVAVCFLGVMGVLSVILFIEFSRIEKQLP